MSYDTSFQRRHGRWLIWLRIATLAPAAISLALLSWALTLHNHVYTDGVGAIGSVMIMSMVGYAFAWSLSYVLASLVKSTSTPMHPGFAVGFDLVAAAGIVSTAIVALVEFDLVDADCNEALRRQCKYEKKLVPAERAADAFAFVDAILHAILFVAACRACVALRRERNGKGQSDVELQSKAAF